MILKIILSLCLIIPLKSNGQQDHAKEIKKFWKRHQTGLLQKFDGPLKPKDIKALEYYPVESKWLVKANLVRSSDPQTIEIPTSANKVKTYKTFGILYFSMNGTDVNIPVYQITGFGANKLLNDHLFLPFTDLTNGEGTYGGGRYIDLTTTMIENDYLLIDFNKAYNPYCAYADGWNCPIPPKSNFIPLEVKAGEKDYYGARRSRK